MTNQIIPVTRIGVGHAKIESGVAERPGEHLELDALRAHAGPQVADAGTGRRIHIGIAVGDVQSGAAVDVLDLEIDAVERIELEVFEVLAEQGNVHVDAGAVIFQADFECVVQFRIELQIGAAGRSGHGAGDGGPVDGLITVCRVNAERSRLKPPAL